MSTGSGNVLNIECADLWQPGTCSLECMRAYKELERQGLIRILGFEVGRHTERMRVRYSSDRPHDQVLGLLKRAKDEMAVRE